MMSHTIEQHGYIDTFFDITYTFTILFIQN